MVNIISLLFLLFAMSVPSTAMADQPDARVLEDSEINACLQKCNAGGNACVDYSKCQSELAECRNLNEGWYAAYNTLAERCGSALATDSQHPPSKTLKSEPKKVSSGGKKWEPPQKVIVCAGGATKSKDGKYCECPDGVPARVLDKESHPNNNVYKAV